MAKKSSFSPLFSLLALFFICSKIPVTSQLHLSQTNVIISSPVTSTLQTNQTVNSILGSLLSNETLAHFWNTRSTVPNGTESVVNLLNLTIIINQLPPQGALMDGTSIPEISFPPFEPDYTPTFPPLLQIPINLTDPENEKRRRFIKSMFMDSWNSYSKFSWGQEALKPLTGADPDTKPLPSTGETILASMSTLWLMGERDEFIRGKKWITNYLNVSELKTRVETQIIVSGYIGALLSCYSLTGDEFFAEKAREITDSISTEPGLTTGLPAQPAQVGAKTQAQVLHEHLFQKIKEITVFPNQRLEYRYLTDLTGDPKYANLIAKNEELAKLAGLSNSNSIASQNLLMKEVKAYIQARRIDEEGLKLYNDTLGNQNPSTGPFVLVEMSNMTFVQRDVKGKMHFSDCNFGSMLGLGSEARKNLLEHVPNGKKSQEWVDRHLWTANRDRELAEKITNTCRRAIADTRIDLPPSSFTVPNGTQQITGYGAQALMPNIAESYFVLYRITRSPKYRKYAWQLAQSIARNCKVGATSGYAQINNVNEEQTKKRDYQPPLFLAGTLKYLYLIFSPVDYVPLDEWVFNSAGHPLPICGRNGAYPIEKCNRKG